MEILDLAAIATKLNSLNTIYSVWRFNKHLRVTYVAPGWLIVWNHRENPPQRYDIREAGDHATVCDLAAAQLQKLAIAYRAVEEDNLHLGFYVARTRKA